jgi:hypothetical protein
MTLTHPEEPPAFSTTWCGAFALAVSCASNFPACFRGYVKWEPGGERALQDYFRLVNRIDSEATANAHTHIQ